MKSLKRPGIKFPLCAVWDSFCSGAASNMKSPPPELFNSSSTAYFRARRVYVSEPSHYAALQAQDSRQNS